MKDFRTAKKIFVATKMWLKERLYLEVSPEKSKITNMRKNYSEFLGFKLKVKKGKKGKYTNRSYMVDKAKENAINKLKEQIKVIQKHPTQTNVNKYNTIVIGLQNYYCIGTMISRDFSNIAYTVNKSLMCRTKRIRAKNGKITKTYTKFYKDYDCKKIFIANTILFPIASIKWKRANLYNQEMTRFTQKGREKIYTKLKINMNILRYIMENSSKSQSVEYNDNRISLYSGQLGKCAITGKNLEIGDMEVHHIIPKFMGGTDKYNNLIFVKSSVHKIIHATTEKTIKLYMSKIKIDKKGFEKLNMLRILVGNNKIEDIIF